jgi:hypothetical protein
MALDKVNSVSYDDWFGGISGRTCCRKIILKVMERNIERWWN